MCEAKSEGLVHYPTTLAPVRGSVTVTAQCADNANTTNTTTLQVTMGAGLDQLLTATLLKDTIKSQSATEYHVKVIVNIHYS